jgi:phosphate transport system protein
VVPELERSHDLVEHIARRGAQGLREELTPRTRGLVERMGALGAEMWQMVGESWTERDAVVLDRLSRRDNEMDELHAALVAELAAGGTSLPVAMDMAIVARFGERVRYLIPGSEVGVPQAAGA